MALVLRYTARSVFNRHYSSGCCTSQVKKSVFISQSTDIFTNLALEDWLYKNFDFSQHHVLMLWKNDPCVVIGRHQNPWIEANVSNLHNITDAGVNLARRNSGGGTVYHDHGNLNLTFFTPREYYNRKYNLQLISRAIFRKYGLNLDISKREDLTIRNYKVSGTASKLGRPNAYHHCTLLVGVNKVDLREALSKKETGIKTTATQSVKSKIKNLCEEIPKINVNDLISAIGWEFMRTPVDSLKDGGLHLANQQKGFQMINPTDQWFPGLAEIRDSLASWDWCYGKTPKFSLTRSFPIPVQLLPSSENVQRDLQITMQVENGKVSDVTIFIPEGLSSSGFSGEAKVVTNIQGRPFTEDSFSALEVSLAGETGETIDGKCKFVSKCVRQVMTSV